MRDTLPKVPWVNESGIVNLQTSKQSSSHWMCYIKRRNYIFYFDRFGDLQATEKINKIFSPTELIVFLQ